MTSAVQTTTATLGGREITVKLPTETQFALLAQQVRIAAGSDRTKVVRAIAIIMDVIHHLIIEADQDYVVDLMAAGKIEVSDTMAILEAFKAEEATSARPAAVRRASRR